MLGDREGPEGTVEGPTSAGEESLLGEGGEVHEPDAGHLVHRHEGAFKGVVERVEGRIIDGAAADGF